MSSDFERFLLDTSPETIRYNCWWRILKTNKQKSNESKIRTTRRTTPKQILAELHEYYEVSFFIHFSIFHSRTLRMPSEKQCIWQHQKRTRPFLSIHCYQEFRFVIHQTTTSNAIPHSHSPLACLHFFLFLPAPSWNVTWLLRSNIKPLSEKSIFFSVTY